MRADLVFESRLPLCDGFTRLPVLKRSLFLFRKSLLRRFADCDFCVVSGVLRDEARVCPIKRAYAPVPETPVAFV